MPNQVNQAFEDFVKSDYDHNANLKTENYSIVVYKDDEVESMWMAWQAATQARESEINSLKQRVEDLRKIARISHMGGLIRLREYEALIEIRKITLPYFDTTESFAEAKQALVTTSAQSLAERKEEYEDKLRSEFKDPNL